MNEGFDEVLMQHIRDYKGTQSELSLKSGVAATVIGRFTSRRRGITLETAEKLIDALGYKIKLVKK